MGLRIACSELQFSLHWVPAHVVYCNVRGRPWRMNIIQRTPIAHTFPEILI